MTERNTPAVIEVCRRLDGIPLATELAAARVRVLAPEEIAARLKDRFRLLVGSSRTAPPRQQTLRAAVDWRYDLLTDAAQRLFEQLSVFVGGFSLDGGGVYHDETHASSVLDLLAHLVDRSLVLAEVWSTPPGWPTWNPNVMRMSLNVRGRSLSSRRARVSLTCLLARRQASGPGSPRLPATASRSR
jgi:hypothetical protein